MKPILVTLLLLCTLTLCGQSAQDAQKQTELTQIEQAQRDLAALAQMSKDTAYNLINVVALSAWTNYKLECMRDTSMICVDVFKFPNKDHEQLVGCKPDNRNIIGWIETRSIYVTRKPILEEYVQWLVDGLRK